MPTNFAQRKNRTQSSDQAHQLKVLRGLEGHGIAAFQLNPDGKIIAALAPAPTRNTCMPGPILYGNELDKLAIAPNEEMRRHFQLSPLDLVLTWGKLSDTQELKKFYYSHGYRFVYLRPNAHNAMPDAGSHLSHIHAIPATDAMREFLESLGQEDIVALTGHLVSVEGPGMNPWTSSLSRHDNGDGACEIFWIDNAQLESDRPGLLEFWVRRFEESF